MDEIECGDKWWTMMWWVGEGSDSDKGGDGGCMEADLKQSN